MKILLNITWQINMGFFSPLWNIETRRTTLCPVITVNIYINTKNNWFSHSAHLLIGIPMMAHPLLFCVNLIKGLPQLSFCTQNFHAISTMILFTQGRQGWTLKEPNHYWILNHFPPHKTANMVWKPISPITVVE